jgi:small subunit ribosomal protein S16
LKKVALGWPEIDKIAKPPIARLQNGIRGDVQLFASNARFRRYLGVESCPNQIRVPPFFGCRLAPSIPKDSNEFSSFFERKCTAVVMIRLARVGARKQPYYRIVVIEKDRARNGRCIEVVGTYNPRTSPASIDLKHERIAYWRGKGAKLSPTMEKLVTNHPAPAASTPAESVSGTAAA